MNIIRVVIADDHPLIREGLRRVLSLDKQIQVVGEAANGEEAIELVTNTQPHVILMDLNMPRFSGMDAAKVILQANPAVRIIALTVEDSERKIVELIKNGVSGYLLKDVSVEALVSTIKAVHAGETVITPQVTQALLKETLEGGRGAASGESVSEALTTREMEIIRLIAAGKNNKDIAEELYISQKTVKNHISSIFRKINVQDRTQAALYAIKSNLVDM